MPCRASQPPIDTALVAKIQPLLSDWANFYGVAVKDFERLSSNHSFMPEHIASIDGKTDETFFVVKLSDTELKYEPLLREYSPNKRYYVPLYEHIVFYDDENKQYYTGLDDSQNIWLYNTKTALGYMIQFVGSSSIAEGTYWLDDNTLILLGKEYDRETHLFFIIFDFGTMKSSYFYDNKGGDYEKNSFYRYVLEKRGLSINDD